jgi:hypothetical protein
MTNIGLGSLGLDQLQEHVVKKGLSSSARSHGSRFRAQCCCCARAHEVKVRLIESHRFVHPAMGWFPAVCSL